MIRVTDITGTQKYINCELIERIEVVPDTIVVLANGHSYIVQESAHEIVERIRRFRARLAPRIIHSSLGERNISFSKFNKKTNRR